MTKIHECDCCAILDKGDWVSTAPRLLWNILQQT